MAQKLAKRKEIYSAGHYPIPQSQIIGPDSMHHGLDKKSTYQKQTTLFYDN